MAKAGPKTVNDSTIAAAVAAGGSDRSVARALHVGRERVSAVRKMATALVPFKAVPVLSVDQFKALCILEISQEETRNEFSDQLNEYTQNYRKAMDSRPPDLDAATKWSALRVRLLEQMVKISGLDKRCEIPQTSEAEAVSRLTDEEVDARARAILAKRDSGNK